MFCSNCGSNIDESMIFCSNCGYNIEIQHELEVANEKVERIEAEILKTGAQFVLCTSRKLGVFKTVLCYLVFYEDKVIMAHLGNDRIKSVMTKYAEDNKTNEKGFFTRLMDSMNFYEDYKHVFMTKKQEEIMAEDIENKEIHYCTMNSMLFKRQMNSQKDYDSKARQGDLIIDTSQGKFKFTHRYFDNDKVIKQALEKVNGIKLKYR